jgi:hypothetical protein
MNANSGRRKVLKFYNLRNFLICLTIVVCKIQHLSRRPLLSRKVQLAPLLLVPSFLLIDYNQIVNMVMDFYRR